MQTITNYSKGVISEDVVSNHLMKRGYSIKNRRYKTKEGEVDIIASCGKTLLFCEVKTASNAFSPELISEKQKARNTKAAMIFLSQNEDYLHHEIRYDLFLVNHYSKSISVVKNAFEFNF